jgi:predicted GIY-YIG superfamily endonuclease
VRLWRIPTASILRFIWATKGEPMVYVYVLQGTTGKRYVGITKNLARRLMEHRSKSSKGGQILGNFILLIKEEYPDYRSEERREERSI